MWVFYLISLPLTLGMVMVTLRYFAGPDVPVHAAGPGGILARHSLEALLPASFGPETLGSEP